MSRHSKNETSSNNIKVRKKHKILKIIIFIIFLAIFIFATVNLIRWAIYNKKSSDLIESIKEDVIIEQVSDEAETENTNPIDFQKLKSINSDVVAWIKIENTNIDYPIVQATDNEYYLHRDINKEYSTCGWIFMDYKNVNTFIDKNTVIYGHNIKSGLMFSGLQSIINNELGTEIIIEIYTETEKLNYKVFSSYMEEPENYAIKSNIVTEDDQEKYIKEMLNRSTIQYNVVPDRSDKLLTLSTCDNTGKYRLLVHATYINGEEY